MGLTEAELRSMLARGDARIIEAEHPWRRPPSVAPAIDWRPHDRYRSKTERRFALEVLAPWQHAAIIQAWQYEPCKGLWLAERTSYTPDFLTVSPHGGVTFYEVKGAFIRPQDWLKFKLAAERYSFWPFILAQYAEGVWAYRNAQSHPLSTTGERL